MKWFPRLQKMMLEVSEKNPRADARDAHEIAKLFGCCGASANEIMIAIGRTQSEGNLQVRTETLKQFLGVFLAIPGIGSKDKSQRLKAFKQGSALYREKLAEGKRAIAEAGWDLFPGPLDRDLDDRLQHAQQDSGKSRKTILREAILSWLEPTGMVSADRFAHDAMIAVALQTQVKLQADPPQKGDGELVAHTESAKLDSHKLPAISLSQREEMDEKIREAKEGIAAKIQQISHSEVLYPTQEVGKFLIDYFYGQIRKKFNERQRTDLWTLLDNRACIITGGTSSDRSLMVTAVVGSLMWAGVTCLVCTPNEGSAFRLAKCVDSFAPHAQTIDQLLEVEKDKRFLCHADEPRDCGLLVVSGVPMIGVLLLCKLLRDLPDTFGLILVDEENHDQSVGPDNALEYLIGSEMLTVVSLDETSVSL